MKKFIVLFAVLAMVFAFAPSAMADVSLYGSARMMTYSHKVDNPGTSFDTTTTQFQLGTLTRFGAKFTSGDISGVWEMDARANSTTNVSHLGDLRIRHAFGEWNFGSGKLLVGKTWPLCNFFVSHLNQTGAGMMFDGGMGAVYARFAQIRLTFGNFKVAFLAPYTGSGNLFASSDTYAYASATGESHTAAGRRDVTFPKIELRYDLKLDSMKFAIAGGYQTFEDVVATSDKGYDVDSYTVGAAGWFDFGPAYLNLGVHYAQNPGNYDLGDRYRMTYSVAAYDATQDTVLDMTGWGGVLALGYKVSDMITLEGGYGMLDYSGDKGSATHEKEDTNKSYYLQCKITLAPGVYVVPEFMVFDKDEYKTNAGVTTEEAKETIFGVWWCINFK